MSSKPHYFAIGVFVLAAAALGLIGVVAVGTDAMHSPKYFIETYVDESVQGIDIGTPFKFRGVKVGNVCEITMVSSEYKTTKMYVMIRVALDEKAMLTEPETLPARIKEQVDAGLRLKMVPQGITGLSFLEADYQPDASAKQLEIDWVPKYTYIPSTPAIMTLLTRSLERIAEQVNELDLGTISGNIEGVTSNLNVSMQNIEVITRNMANASDAVTENIRIASDDLPGIASNMMATVSLVQNLLNESDRDIARIIENLRYITDDGFELIRKIKHNPGMFLSGPPARNLNLAEEKK